MKKALHIGPGLELPLTAVTATFGLLAVRGAGKSNAAAVMAEEMFDCGLPFVAIDPVGSWWGLRAGADGSREGGLPIPIFGGRHGDLPLERGAGELLADLIAEKRLSCVLDLSAFESESEKKGFLLAFARRLYLKNESPLHLFLEEADDYIPQKPFRDEAQLLRAWENIVRRGRSRGLGMTLITQRSAAINKMVLTQVETLFALRTTGPQDIAAIEAWVKYHQADQEIVRSLAGLEAGEAWIWSPSFLKALKKVRIRRRRTFDSGATPKNVRGGEAKKPATLADVDLAVLQQQLSASIEKAKADDPRELRRRLAALELALATAKAATPAPERIEVPAIQPEQLERLQRLVAELDGLAAKADDLSDRLVTEAAGLRAGLAQAAGSLAARFLAPAGRAQGMSRPTFADAKPNFTPSVQARSSQFPGENRKPAPAAAGAEKLGLAERKVLGALAQYPGGRTKVQLALLAGYAHSGGGFNNALSSLRTRGLLEGAGDRLKATAAGLAIAPADPLPRGRALLEYWLGQLGKAERLVLEQLAVHWPGGMEKAALGQATGYEPNGGGFNNALSRLRTLELIEGRGELRASAIFFEEA
jgi:hypothetical protein